MPELLRSVNYQLLAVGLVYPTFYSKLYTDLRATLASAAVASRASLAGVWGDDVTFEGFELLSRQQLMDSVIVMPKLFRRFAEYLAADPTGGVDLADFSTFLIARADQLYLPPDPTLTTLDTLVRVAGQRASLTLEPEQIVFVEA